jgi:hypothetical protein
MRTELLFRGVKPAPLFSYRDRTLREMLAKIKVSESHQLMATLAASVGDTKLANESNSKYRDSIWYSKITEDRNENMFKEYYTKYKHMQPELFKGEDGVLSVRGLT